MKNGENLPVTTKTMRTDLTMEHQPGTMKNHENLPGTIKNQPGTMKTIKTDPQAAQTLQMVLTDY